MAYASSFDRFVCVGDTIQADVDGFTVTARIVHDESTCPDDFDCYDDAIVAAWRNDEWFFCGVCVQVSRAGIDLTGPYGAALWGVEANFPGSDNAYLTGIATDLISEAIADARAAMARLVADTL
jgi:hypothetical protein